MTASDTSRETDPAGPTDLEQFVELVSHELRTPLAVVVTAAETAMTHWSDQVDEGLRHILEVIDRNSRLASLLVDRLGLARDVEAGSVQLNLQHVDLAQVARDSVDDLAQVLLSEHPTTVTAPEPAKVVADPTAVREIIFNLLSNATKYSARDAAIDVTVTPRPDVAEMTVRNHGTGVTPGATEQIFDEHFQGDPGSPGVGLGLFISRGLARAHGGDLRVEAAASEGSVFVFTLPRPSGPGWGDPGSGGP